MHRSSRRLIALALGLAAFVVGSALLYQVGMAHLEGKQRTFWDAIEWAAETLSTTGYGYDSHWTHPAMVILVVAVEFVGVFLFFLIVPIFMIPFVEEPAHRRPIELAGATSAYTPRHIIAAALAAHASDRISPRLPGADAIAGLDRREIRVSQSSPIANKTLAEAQIGARAGAIVV